MAGDENLPGQRPEGQGEEPHLPQPELGQRAYQLIKDYKQAIRRTPEFAQALQDLYFAETPHNEYSMWRSPNPFERAIDFVRGDYKYEVQYQTETEKEELHVAKFPIKPDEHDWWFESVTLLGYVNRESRQFDGGGIQHAKFHKDAREDHPTNTPTAIQRVQEFLTTNFGNS